MLFLLQLRPIQFFLAQKILERVSDKTNHEISIDKIKISWLDQASIEGILVKDLANDTLIFSKKITINYSIRDIINGNYLSIEEIRGNDLRLKLVKHDSTSQLNLLIFLNNDFIYTVYDLDENSDGINQKRQMQKSTKGSMITYITSVWLKVT